MTYEQQILQILTMAGERGISVSAVTKHVYNQNCTFFSQPDLVEIKQFVQQYLLKNSKTSSSLVESMGKRGYYRLNTNDSADARQLMLDFREQEDGVETEEKKMPQDLSLDLFSEVF